LMVRPLNGLYFANAVGFREAIMTELLSRDEPVKAVLLDLSATTDLDVPSADTLAELSEELHSRDVRFMLYHVITPVRKMLEHAGVMEKIGLQDIFSTPVEAVTNYLLWQCDYAGIEDLLRSGGQTINDLLQVSLSSAPVEHQAAIAEIVDNLDKEIRRSQQ
jgi:sulfate permease, SulP family